MSPLLLAELDEVLARPKFRRWLSADEAQQFVADLKLLADEVEDPGTEPSERSVDPDDDFVVALAEIARAEALVSGDPHLLDLDLERTVVTPATFLQRFQT